MKIRSRNIKDLDRVISHEVKSRTAKAGTQTAIVMGLFIASSGLPLPQHKFSLE